MPFYEEKIISPLSIRFTQQRIRTSFQDGREVEASIGEIKAMPGTGDYDVILHAPFPTIEIIRWSPNGRRAGGQDHWFSRDNRRLYCLQRAAAEHWPKRVGAMVEVLFADPGDTRKKLDSQTGGQAVSIGHAFATDDELEKWAWREAVKEQGSYGDALQEAEAAVAADDAKSSVHDLTEAPAAPSAYERLCEAEICSPAVAPKATIPEAEICSPAVASKAKATTSDREKPAAPSSYERLSAVHETEMQSSVVESKVMPEEDVKPQEQPSLPSKLSPGVQSLSGLIGQLFASSIESKVMPEEDVKAKEQPSFPSESPEVQSLSGLIGQLLVLPEEDVKRQEQPSLPSKSPEVQSLSGLIGQLLVLKSAEPPQTSAVPCPRSLVLKSAESPQTESTDSPASVMEAFRASSLSGDEDKARSDSSAKDSTAPAPKQKSPGKKVSKEITAAKLAQQQQAQAARAMRAQAAVFQRAQMQRWQMAQYQSAQMARWQHASMAFQAAQFQAAQASEWQEAWA